MPIFDPLGPAGPELLHPMRVDFETHFDAVGGPGFDDIAARPWKPLALPAHLPQVRALPRLRGERIERALVGVRLDEMFVGGHVRPADHLRERAGLPESTDIVLLLFGPDQLLEELWAVRESALTEIAEGGYALVLPPSYSLWEPRRRPNNLLSLRRSHLVYGELQQRGANAVPRLGWVEHTDVERWSVWLNSNPLVEVASLDLMTYQGPHFDRQVALLAEFDALTGERVHFVANGVRAPRRILALYTATSPERVTVSSATLVPPPPVASLVAGVAKGSFAARAAEVDASCLHARQVVEMAAAGEDVEVLLANILARADARTGVLAA
jgi:hypothetical protein